MIKVAKKSAMAPARAAVQKQISQLREEIEELSDYLDLLEARATNNGKRRYSTAEAQKRLRLT